MGKKKTKIQKDLFGKNIKEDPYQQTIYSIAKKYKSSEKPKKFDFEEWQGRVDKWTTQGNKAKKLECYDEIEPVVAVYNRYFLLKTPIPTRAFAVRRSNHLNLKKLDRRFKQNSGSYFAIPAQ